MKSSYKALSWKDIPSGDNYYRALKRQKIDQAAKILSSQILTQEQYKFLLSRSLEPDPAPLCLRTVKMLLDYYLGYKDIWDKGIILKQCHQRYDARREDVPGDVQVLLYKYGQIPLPFPKFLVVDGLSFLGHVVSELLFEGEGSVIQFDNNRFTNFDICTLAAIMPFWRKYFIKEEATSQRNALLHVVIPIRDLENIISAYLDQTDVDSLVPILTFVIEKDFFRIVNGTTASWHVKPTLELFRDTNLSKVERFLTQGWSIVELCSDKERTAECSFNWQYNEIEWMRECETFEEILQWRALLSCLYDEEQMN